MGPCCATESKLRRFSKELCLKQQRPASITRPWSPVYLKRRRSNGGRRKNEHGQSLCDSECPIQLQQPCPERPRPFEGRRPRTTSARTPAEGGFYIPGERGGPSSLGGGGAAAGLAGSGDIEKRPRKRLLFLRRTRRESADPNSR